MPFCFQIEIADFVAFLPTAKFELFSWCEDLTEITIPEGVASIGSSSFGDCTGLRRIVFKPTTPPSVASANAWDNLATDCEIVVPAGSLSAYTSAANYPDSSVYTYEEEI